MTLGIGVLLMLVGVIATAWTQGEKARLDRHFESLRRAGVPVTGYVESTYCSKRMFKTCTINEVYEVGGVRRSVQFVEKLSDDVLARKRETLFVSASDPGDVVSQSGTPTRVAWRTATLAGPVLVAIGGIMVVVMIAIGHHSRRSRNYFDVLPV